MLRRWISWPFNDGATVYVAHFHRFLIVVTVNILQSASNFRRALQRALKRKKIGKFPNFFCYESFDAKNVFLYFLIQDTVNISLFLLYKPNKGLPVLGNKLRRKRWKNVFETVFSKVHFYVFFEIFVTFDVISQKV